MKVTVLCAYRLCTLYMVQLYASQNIKLAQKVDTQQNNVTQVIIFGCNAMFIVAKY